MSGNLLCPTIFCPYYICSGGREQATHYIFVHRALNATCWHQTHVLLQKIPGNMKRSGTPNLKGCPNQTNYCTPLPEEQKISVAQRKKKKRHILMPAQKETHRSHRFSARKPAEMPPGSMKRAATLLVCQRARQTPVALP